MDYIYNPDRLELTLADYGLDSYIEVDYIRDMAEKLKHTDITMRNKKELR